MKHTLAIMAALAMAGAAAHAADGTLWLNNYDQDGGNGYPIYYLAEGTVLASGWVQIFGNGTAIGDKLPVADGFFDNGYGVVAGVAEGANADIKLQAWKGDGTYADATEKAEATWNQKVGTNPALPATPSPEMLNLPKGIIVKAGEVNPVVPEPSTIALALLGGAALLLRRRN